MATEPTVSPQEPLLQFFAYDHLPVHLRDVSRPFGELAALIVQTLPRNPERTTALRKLLEAKDCAVRAVLFEGGPAESAASRTAHAERTDQRMMDAAKRTA